MAKQIELGRAEQVHARIQRVGTIIVTNERWFKHLPSDEVWRLEDPDPPFYGTFERDKAFNASFGSP